MSTFISTLSSILNRPIGVAPGASAMDLQLLLPRQAQAHVGPQN